MGIEEFDRNELLYTLFDYIDEYRHFMVLLDNWEDSLDIRDIGVVGHFMVSQYRDGRVKAIRDFNLKMRKK